MPRRRSSCASRRGTYRIPARHATSFGEQLREAHLQQAYEMLADARLNHLTIRK